MSGLCAGYERCVLAVGERWRSPSGGGPLRSADEHVRPELAERAADALALAMIALGRDRQVLWANAAARAAAEGGDGLILRSGRLAAESGPNQAHLEAAATRALAFPGGATALRLRRGDGDGDLSVVVTTLHPGAAALVLFRPTPRLSSGDADVLARLFGLTRAETGVALALAEGRSVAEIALARGASANTVRVQLKAIAAKMGLSRQTQIVAALASLPPLAACRHADADVTFVVSSDRWA